MQRPGREGAPLYSGLPLHQRCSRYSWSVALAMQLHSPAIMPRYASVLLEQLSDTEIIDHLLSRAAAKSPPALVPCKAMLPLLV